MIRHVISLTWIYFLTRVVRYRYSRLIFTSEDRANLRMQEQSTNMTSQCQCPTFAWRHRSTVVTSQYLIRKKLSYACGICKNKPRLDCWFWPILMFPFLLMTNVLKPSPATDRRMNTHITAGYRINRVNGVSSILSLIREILSKRMLCFRKKGFVSSTVTIYIDAYCNLMLIYIFNYCLI